MLSNFKFFVIFLSIIFNFTFADVIDKNSSQFKVAIKPISPFVIDKNKTMEGFSIDLWKEIAKDLNISYTFVVKLCPLFIR